MGLNLENIVFMNKEVRIKDMNLSKEISQKTQLFYSDKKDYSELDNDMYACARIIYFLALSAVDSIWTPEDHFEIF